VDSLVRVWQAWVEEALSGWCPHDARAGLAIDGKVVRGSAALEVLGAMVHGLGVMLANHPIPESTNEAGALQPFLESLLLEGRVVTLDAAHTSQATAQAVVQKWHTTQKRHGRLVRYRVRATAALNDYLRKEFGWRFVGQCLCIERECHGRTHQPHALRHHRFVAATSQRAHPVCPVASALAYREQRPLDMTSGKTTVPLIVATRRACW